GAFDPRRSHVDADLSVRLDRDPLPTGGREHHELGPGPHTGVDHGPGDTAETVSAGLGLAAVRVPEAHAHVGTLAPARHPDEAVGPHAPVSIAQLPSALGVDALTLVEVEQDQEVVPEPVVLDELHR